MAVTQPILTETKTIQRTGNYAYSTGKRKSSVAKVRLYENGKGDIFINNQPMEEYFFGTLIGNILWPLKLAKLEKTFDVVVVLQGGGMHSQSDAVRHGIARALTVFDPALRPILKKAGLLSRDSRVKERKKPGLKRARRAPQWAKR
ncbi:MAG: 30S ribosomal protein S9 [Candidatus Peregrinibacteria bacterium]